MVGKSHNETKSSQKRFCWLIVIFDPLLRCESRDKMFTAEK